MQAQCLTPDAGRPTTPAPSVLVVDDDANVLASVHALLSGHCVLRAARNGADALRLARSERPDLVLLDIEMPGLSGLAVCRAMKEDPLLADVPVIFLTLNNDEATEVEGLAAGAVDFIAKPPRGPVVLARIQTHVRMKRMADALRAEALTDSLTGLGNRRRWDDTLPREWLRALRAGAPLAVLMIDVDHFKAYNDRHGHAAGDACLRRVAVGLKGCLNRPADLLVRYGGEEFAMLLPDSSGPGAAALSAQVVDAVDGLRVPHGASPVGPWVSVSVGAAAYDDSAAAWVEPGQDSRLATLLPRPQAADVVNAADQALYEAKRAGRARAAFRPL
jgi:diguanylate cyclase (GGDEF)-like protein